MNFLNKNVGTADRIVRMSSGLLMVYFGLIEKTIITDELGAILLVGFGGMFILSAILSACPLYNVIGINTCSGAKQSNDG